MGKPFKEMGNTKSRWRYFNDANECIQRWHSKWILKRLSNFATNEKNRVAIAATGGIDAILMAMQRHVSNADVQENGCGALMNLSVNGNNQALIAELGGMDAIILTMQSHVSNAYRVMFKHMVVAH